MASRYRQFIRLIAEWPLDESKTHRDLGAFLRKKVTERFSQGDATTVDEEFCKRQYEALHRINSNIHKHKYPTKARTVGTVDLNAEQLNELLSTESVQEVKKNSMSIVERMKASF